MSDRFVAVLDTMWGAPGRAPLFFRINPRNHSGRRLYWLTDANSQSLLVVNACPQLVGHATKHGTPDTEWLARSLRALPATFQRATLLVCGKVAQRTYDASGVRWRGPIHYIDHPAARRWSRASLDSTRSILTRSPIMPSAKKAAKQSKKSVKKLAAEQLTVEVRKIRPQLVSAASSITRVLGLKPLAKANKKLTKRMKAARKAIDKVIATLGK